MTTNFTSCEGTDWAEYLNLIRRDLNQSEPDYEEVARKFDLFERCKDSISESLRAEGSALLKKAQDQFQNEFQARYSEALECLGARSCTFVERVDQLGSLFNPHFSLNSENAFFQRCFGDLVVEQSHEVQDWIELLDADDRWPERKVRLLIEHVCFRLETRIYEDTGFHSWLREYGLKLGQAVRHFKIDERDFPGADGVRQFKALKKELKDCADRVDDALRTEEQYWEVSTLLQNDDLTGIFAKWDHILSAAERDDRYDEIVGESRRWYVKLCLDAIKRNFQAVTGKPIAVYPDDMPLWLNSDLRLAEVYKEIVQAWVYFDPIHRRHDPAARDVIVSLDIDEFQSIREKPNPKFLPSRVEKKEWQRLDRAVKKLFPQIKDIVSKFKTIRQRSMSAISERALAPNDLTYLYDNVLPYHNHPSTMTIAHWVTRKTCQHYRNDFHDLKIRITQREIRRDGFPEFIRKTDEFIGVLKSSPIMRQTEYPTQAHVNEIKLLLRDVESFRSELQRAPHQIDTMRGDLVRLQKARQEGRRIEAQELQAEIKYNIDSGWLDYMSSAEKEGFLAEFDAVCSGLESD